MFGFIQGLVLPIRDDNRVGLSRVWQNPYPSFGGTDRGELENETPWFDYSKYQPGMTRIINKVLILET